MKHRKHKINWCKTNGGFAIKHNGKKKKTTQLLLHQTNIISSNLNHEYFSSITNSRHPGV